MPAVKIKPRSSQRVSVDSTEVSTQNSPVLIVVDGDTLEVYTGQEAVDKLAE